MLWQWRRPAAVAPIGPPAWESPYAAGVVIKSKKKKKKKKTNKKKNLNIELPYDASIPLLGIYPEKTIL